MPQILRQKDGNISLGTLGKADFTVEVKSLSGSLAYLALDMLHNGLSKKINDCAAKAKGRVKITLEVSTDVPAEVKKNADQAYSIKAENNAISLIGAGIVNGKNDKIAPLDYTTRAEVAVLVKRILDLRYVG